MTEESVVDFLKADGRLYGVPIKELILYFTKKNKCLATPEDHKVVQRLKSFNSTKFIVKDYYYGDPYVQLAENNNHPSNSVSLKIIEESELINSAKFSSELRNTTISECKQIIVDR